MTDPSTITQFYATIAGAAATLIGFLAVANSIIESKDNTKTATLQEGILAESAYIAFVNVFIVSLIALEPFINAGYGATLLAILGMISTWRLAKSGLYRLAKISISRARISKTILLMGALTYAAEFVVGILFILNRDRAEALLAFVYILVILTGVGLSRAWELMGVRKVLGG